MSKARGLKIAASVVASFVCFVVLIAYLALSEILSLQQAGLMVIALFGIYIGFGVLIGVYRLINKLE